MNEPLNGIAPLNHLGVIRVQGEDAAKFLHGQLTQDFLLLKADEARLAAFCSAKGRMQASFIALAWAPHDFLLICERDLLAQTLKRLSMFVLRAKAKLSDATADFRLHGLVGASVKQAIPGSTAPWTRVAMGDDATGVGIVLYPADEQPRALRVTPADGSAATPYAPTNELTTEQWRWTEVRSGVVLISHPLFEALVPQMLNYESVGGVNFKKGCYPGQEIVARSQFRGTLKRRAYRVHCGLALAAGQEVFQSADVEQPCGVVVQAAAAPGGGWDAVVSMQVAAAEAGGLRAGSADGPPLALMPLPYPLLEDI